MKSTPPDNRARDRAEAYSPRPAGGSIMAGVCVGVVALLGVKVAQLTDDVVDLSAQVVRSQQQAARFIGRSASHPNPLGGGQDF